MRDAIADTDNPTHPPEAGLRDIWPYVRPFRRRLLVALVLSLLGALAAVAQPLVVARIVDSFGSGVATTAVVLLVSLLLVSAVLGTVQQLILERSSEHLVFSVRQRLVSHLLHLPISTLDHRSRGDLVSRVSADTSAMRDVLSQGVVELCAQLLTVVAALVMMLLIDPLLVLLVLAVVVVLVVAVVLLGRRTRPAANELQTQVGLLSARTERALGGIRTIRATRATEHEVSGAVATAHGALAAGLRVAWLKAVVGSFAGVAVQVLLLAVVGAGALRVAAGQLTLGELGAFVMYVMLIVAPVALLAGIVTSMGEALGAFARVQAVLRLPVESRASTSAVDIPTLGEGVDFEFHDVSFRYANAPEGAWALRDVSFTVPSHRFTAFVGPSGAGKSTIFALMEQFYDPTGGAISFRGTDIATMPRDAVRARMAYVEQDAPALAGTVRENLLVGDREATDAQCIEALRSSNLLPERDAPLDFLGREVGENGILLSGGERQRLAIARALLSRAEVLLLDEATSNLDSANESMLQQAIERVSAQCTVVVIAHRLSTIVAADQIVVMEGGRVTACGTHTELLAASPLYDELVRLQQIEVPTT